LEISNDDISGIVISLYVTDHLASLIGTPRLASPRLAIHGLLRRVRNIDAGVWSWTARV